MICGPYCGIRNHNRVLHFAQTFTLCQEIEAGVNELKRAGSDDDNIELITLEIDYLGGDFFFRNLILNQSISYLEEKF